MGSQSPTVRFYTLSNPTSERADRMRKRFETIGIPLMITPQVPLDDPRFDPDYEARLQSITWGHLEMFREFLASDSEYGVFMEDDIYIRKDIASFLPEIVAMYERLQLDVFLLGYLQPTPPSTVTAAAGYALAGAPLVALEYPEHQWGAQMYMVNRRWAAVLLERCSAGPHSVKAQFHTEFCPDWIFTKWGRRAALWPMMAVEEGVIAFDHPVHVSFHTQCKAANYDASLHI
jgi:hypothetical protein